MTYVVVNQDMNGKEDPTRRIGDVLPGGFQVMVLATQAVFESGDMVARRPCYAVESDALDGAVRASTGMSVYAWPLTACSSADTWLVVDVVSPPSSGRHSPHKTCLGRFGEHAISMRSTRKRWAELGICGQRPSEPGRNSVEHYRKSKAAPKTTPAIENVASRHGRMKSAAPKSP